MRILVLVIYFFSLPVLAGEAVKGLPSSNYQLSDDECMWRMKELRRTMLYTLYDKISKVQNTRDCIGRDSIWFSDCKNIRKKAYTELQSLEQHRQNQASIDMQFRPGSGFELRTRALGLGTNEEGSLTIVNGSLRNGLAQRIQGLSKEEEQTFWQQHQKDLSEYLAKEWWPQQQDKFPGWRQCLQTEGERIVLDPDRMEYQRVVQRPSERHLLFPRFVPKYNCTSLTDRACRTNHQTCQKLVEFWETAPYGADYDRSRMRKSAVKDSELQKGLPPWLYNVAGPVDTKDEEKMKSAAYAAHDKLLFQMKKLKTWIEGLEDYQLANLREFTDPKTDDYYKRCGNFQRKGVSSLFCDDHGQSMTGSRLIDECVAGFFMPANAALSLFQDELNNQAFLAGLKDRKNWQESHDENVRSQMTSTMYAVPMTVAEGAAGAAVAKGVKKVAGKVYDVTLRMKPYRKLVSDSLFENKEFRSLVIYLEDKGYTKDQIKNALESASWQCR